MRRPSSWAAALRSPVVLVLLGPALATALAGVTTPRSRPPAPAASAPAASARASDVLASVPVSFEPVGDDAFASRGPGYSLTLTPAEAVLGVRGGAFRLRPAGPTANPAARLVGSRPLAGTVNRLVGDDPARWRAGLSTYGRVEARQVWPGVDMVWHGDRRGLEHDMVVAPGVDPAVVALDVDGARSLAVDAKGDLVLDLGGGAARLARPVVYQDVGGARRHVPGDFTLLGPSRIGFQVGSYDQSLPLVIDPTLVTSTFLGGSGNDSGYAVALDGQGNVYVTGSTESADFPVAVPAQGGLANAAAGPTSDVFVTKLSPDGGRLVWSTYLGGRGRDTGYGVAVGGDGTVYVSGVTESPDFPQARAAQPAYGGGPSDGFAAKIAANGTTIEWSTFVGGTRTDRARGLAVDAAGNAFVTGSTNSADFPAVNAHQPGPFRAEDLDAFLAKVPTAGAPFAFSTRLGGSNDDHGLAVAVDGQGNAYVTGDTLSPAFPTLRPIQAGSGGSAGGVAGSFPDAFVSKFNPAGSALVYSTFLGGTDVDQGTAIAVDAQGAAYVAGNTASPDFPTANPLQPRKDSDSDAFVAKIDPPGAALVYSTYVGGAGADGANGVAVDSAGNVHVVGTTGSANWPTSRPVQESRNGPDDGFVLKLNPSGDRYLFSSFLGGRDADAGMGVAVDTRGVVHVLGLTTSADFPSVKPFQGARPQAGNDAFVASLDVTDTAASATTTAAGAPSAAGGARAASSDSTGRDRRIRALSWLTVLLLFAAVAQTIFLRRRAPATPAKAAPRATPKPSAGAGVKVLDGPGSGGAKKSTSAKAGAASKSNRAPKVRGGPKGGTAQKAATEKRAPDRAKAGAATTSGSATASADVAEDGGLPTEAVPATPPVKARPQEPAVAQMLEEDIWAPRAPAEPAPELDVEADHRELEQPRPPEPPPPPPPEQPPGIEPPQQPVTSPSPQSGPAIPPVPAADLSFWDLFPEDLPPARATPVPAEEDLLVEHLALPEGPESATGRLGSGPMAQPGPPDETEAAEAEPQPPTPPRRPDADIVIAELLDGPLPMDLRPSEEWEWGPQSPGDDLVISDLLADEPVAPRQGERRHEGGPEQADETPAASRPGPGKDEQARIAADRARRRRRSRGSGRRKPGSG